MKASVDSGLCTGHAQCSAMGPEVYDLDDAGYCVIPVEQIAERLRDQAIAGAEACPERAITLEP